MNHIQTPLNPLTQKGYFFAWLIMVEESNALTLFTYGSMLYNSSSYGGFQVWFLFWVWDSEIPGIPKYGTEGFCSRNESDIVKVKRLRSLATRRMTHSNRQH